MRRKGGDGRRLPPGVILIDDFSQSTPQITSGGSTTDDITVPVGILEGERDQQFFGNAVQTSFEVTGGATDQAITIGGLYSPIAA